MNRGTTGHDIGYAVRDGVVTISSEYDLKPRKVFRVYDIRDLIAHIRRHEGPDAEPGDASSAIRYMIRNHVDRDSWRDAGGKDGRAFEIGGLLVITQTIANHQAIDELLGNLRRHVKTPGLDTRSYLDTPAALAARKQFEVKIPKLDLENVEFEKAVLVLRDMSGLDLRIKWRNFPKKNGGLFDKVNVYLKNVTCKEALNAVLKSGRRHLGPWPCYAVIGGEIRIVPYDKLPVPVRIYDVRDLIAPICEHKGWSFNRQEAVYFIEALISCIVDRDSWRLAGGEAGSITMLDGLFVIGQTVANHEAIVELLGCLRSYFKTRNPGPYSPFETETERALSKQFEAKIPKLDLEDVELGRAVQTLLDISGLNSHIRLRKPVGDDGDLPSKVSVHLRNVTPGEALTAILDSVNEQDEDALGPDLKYVIAGGVMTIAYQLDWRHPPIIRIYDARDIIAREINSTKVTPETYEKAVTGIIDMICKEVDPHSWRTVGGEYRTPGEFVGLLFVEQTTENHEALAALLEELRAKE